MGKAVRIVSKDNEGNEKVVIVKKPSHTQMVDAQFYSSSVFNKAKNAGACLRSKLDEFLFEQGIWTNKERERVDTLRKKLEESLSILETGKDKDGKKVKLSDARKIAIEARRDRLEMNLILIKRNEHDKYTVEGQAENARFDYLVSVCVFDEEGNRVFSSIDDYYDKQEEQYAYDAAAKLSNITFSLDENWEKNLPENRFLTKFKFVDESGRYVNKDGHFVDVEGNRVNELGLRIDNEGNVIDEVPSEKQEPEFEDDVYSSVTVV